MKNLFLACCGLLGGAGPALGQADSDPPARPFSVGVLGTYQALGLQADCRFARSWGVKLAGVRQFGHERAGEFGQAGLGLLTYYLPTRSKLVEPVLGLGAVRSEYHWAQAGRTGHLADWNVGGGFGTNLRFSPRLRTGLYVFVHNGFRAEYQPAAADMVVTGRRLVVFPALTLDVAL